MRRAARARSRAAAAHVGDVEPFGADADGAILSDFR
jgi:hypothetical protein